MKKTILKLGILGFSIIGAFFMNVSEIEAQVIGGEDDGCPMIMMGMEFPCKRIWCSTTMSMSGCGAGYSTSQDCDSWANC
ncbi:hypothetical protein [Algoriphagus sp. CAU 1675]|uniref:hypothetical protein n=1 Tax=Algoriphagus sp. CAU 1675 TaxID=3032597 RepID=UPI0023DB0843|nr:hypothetical protein [Algoriphagus sp. CAU 1675]MDF2156934.1 hypothetical protein [Algoriphagus sp. CAU 1675]